MWNNSWKISREIGNKTRMLDGNIFQFGFRVWLVMVWDSDHCVPNSIFEGHVL